MVGVACAPCFGLVFLPAAPAAGPTARFAAAATGVCTVRAAAVIGFACTPPAPLAAPPASNGPMTPVAGWCRGMPVPARASAAAPAALSAEALACERGTLLSREDVIWLSRDGKLGFSNTLASASGNEAFAVTPPLESAVFTA